MSNITQKSFRCLIIYFIFKNIQLKTIKITIKMENQEPEMSIVLGSSSENSLNSLNSINLNEDESDVEPKDNPKDESPNIPEVEVKLEPEIESEIQVKIDPEIEPEVEVKQVVNYDTLVLSGCSQKGFVTLGALQYCNDNFLLIDTKYFIGTSAGAIICYLLIIGYTPIEIVVYLCTNQILERMQNLNIVAMIQGNGASSFNHLQEHLERMTIEKIGYLPTMLDIYNKFGKTLVCITHNVTENITEYISHETYPSIPCLTALHMSANLPLIFDKFKYGNSFYVDGGLSDNFGIQLGDKLGNKVLGLHLYGDLGNNSQSDSEIESLEYIYKILLIPIDKATHYKISLASDNCDIIQLKSNPKKFFNFDMNSKEKMEMFCSGYNQIRETL